MPAQTNVAIRAHQRACEVAGLLVSLDSLAMTNLKLQETAGQVAKIRVNDRVFYINGTVYNPGSE